MTIRHCIGCNTTIELCNGFVIARDVIAFDQGQRQKIARELCSDCAMRANQNNQWFEQIIEATE